MYTSMGYPQSFYKVCFRGAKIFRDQVLVRVDEAEKGPWVTFSDPPQTFFPTFF
jgi:hypothetical protein